MPVWIRTMINHDIKTVRVEDINNIREYIQNALVKFNQPMPDGEEVFLFYDHWGESIDPLDFVGYVGQSIGCGNFFVEIRKKDNDQPVATASEFMKFLMDNGGKDIMEEGMRLNNLRPATMRKLIALMLDFMVTKFGLHADHLQMTQVCTACVGCIPCLKSANSTIGGIEILYNYVTKPPTGQFFNKVKNEKQKQKQIDHAAPMEFNEDEAELIQFFKNCVVGTSKDQLLSKLQETVALRKELIRKASTNFHELFSFYFVDAMIILKDFELQHPNADPLALLNTWPRISNEPYKQYNMRIDLPQKYPERSAEDLFMFLKLLIPKKSSFKEALAALVVYSNDPNAEPKAMMNSRNKHPYIIAIYSEHENRAKYYIDLEKHLICVPQDFSFIEAYDMLYKIHRIFDMEFEKKLKPLMVFFDHFIYGFDNETSITAHMHEVANNIIPNIRLVR